jgi:hypothetical protein
MRLRYLRLRCRAACSACAACSAADLRRLVCRWVALGLPLGRPGFAVVLPVFRCTRPHSSALGLLCDDDTLARYGAPDCCVSLNCWVSFAPTSLRARWHCKRRDFSFCIGGRPRSSNDRREPRWAAPSPRRRRRSADAAYRARPAPRNRNALDLCARFVAA